MKRKNSNRQFNNLFDAARQSLLNLSDHLSNGGAETEQTIDVFARMTAEIIANQQGTSQVLFKQFAEQLQQELLKIDENMPVDNLDTLSDTPYEEAMTKQLALMLGDVQTQGQAISWLASTGLQMWEFLQRLLPEEFKTFDVNMHALEMLLICLIYEYSLPQDRFQVASRFTSNLLQVFELIIPKDNELVH